MHDPNLNKILALAVILVFSWINYRGIRWGGKTQDLFTLGSLLILVAFIAGGLFCGKGSWSHFALSSAPVPPLTNVFGSAMIAIVFTYSGWFTSAYVGSEIVKPERNLPLSLILGTAVVGVLYTLINVTYLYALPIAEIKGAVNIGQIAATALFNGTISNLISLAIILAICASINATILGGARIFYAMAKDRIFFNSLKKLHPRYRTPYLAILSQAALAVLLVWLGTFDQLLSYVVFVMLISSVATGIVHLILRRRKPALPRPFLTWGYPATPIMFIFSYLWISKEIFLEKTAVSLTGLLLALSGLPLYFLWKKSNAHNHNI